MDAIVAFCKKWAVSEFALFGSVLRDDFRPDSDVDVMVVFEPHATPSLFTLADMKDELETMFGRKVDLLTRRGVEQSINWYRRRHILERARVIYGG
jgi:predicted nucleotidyltransferase